MGADTIETSSSGAVACGEERNIVTAGNEAFCGMRGDLFPRAVVGLYIATSNRWWLTVRNPWVISRLILSIHWRVAVAVWMSILRRGEPE